MKLLGMIAAIAMPLWNIPLIIKIEQRKSSKDISAAWALGVFACILLMLPSGIISPDPVFRIFTLVNSVLFGGVTFQVLRYRNGGPTA